MSTKKTSTTNTQKQKIKVVYVPPGLLKPADYNPRKIDPDLFELLKQSIKEEGFVDPAIANSAPSRKNIIIGGHQRVRAAIEIRLAKIPVIYLNIPNLLAEQKLNLRLNRLLGDFDDNKLMNFDIEMLLDAGFNDVDLGNIWNSNLETEDDGFDVEKILAEIKNPTTRLGDIFRLGNHLLICGDATDPAVVRKLTKSKTVDMIYCDSPYNIGLSYVNGLTTKGKYQGHQTNDRLSKERFSAFLSKSIENALSIAKDDVHVFYWCDETYIGLIQELFERHGLKNRRVCLWIKNNFNMTPQVAFNKAMEPCVYATRNKPFLAPTLTNLNEVMNKEVTSGNRLSDDILDLLSIWLVKRIAAQDYQHPTEKPPTLHEKTLRRCTRPGDTVLDLFGGSGSTLVACEQMKRKCLTVELEPVFCDVIIKRFELLTQTHAQKIN